MAPAYGASMRVEEVVLVTGKGRYPIQAEIADTPALKARGLMFRRSLDADKGMLFLSKPAREAAMWMKNTYIPLDMIFIAQGGRVHHIAKDTVPFSEEHISSNGPVVAVLELAAGSAERLGLKKGDTVEHPFFTKE